MINDHRKLLERRLVAAADKLRRVTRRRAMFAAIDRVSRVLLYGGLAFALTLVAGSIVGCPTSMVLVPVAVTGFAIALAIRSAFRSVQSMLPNLHNVAERLDLAVGDGRNAIATALDLACAGNTSIFARLATAAGIGAIASAEHIDPVMSPATLNVGRASGRIFVGIAAAALGVIVHSRMSAGLGSPAAHGVSSASAVSMASVVAEPVVENPLDRPGPLEDVAMPSATASTSGAQTNAERTQRSAAASASAGAATDAHGAAALPTAKPRDGDRSRNAASPVKSPTKGAAASGAMPKSTSAGTSASVASPSTNPPLAGASGDVPSTDAQDVPTSATDPADASVQAAVQSAAAAAAAANETADAEGEPGGGKPNGKGRGGGGIAPVTEGAGGKGQSSSENPPKKSRGVAPLMLGTRLPDLIQGRQLPGPDQRTDLDVPPQPTPEPTLPSVAIPPRQGAELPVDTYRVPAAWRGTVNRYFEQYHDDRASASADLAH